MKLAIMQPYLFPYIGYFQLVSAVDKFVFYDDVNFIKQGWINRNRIQNNGNVINYSVPLADASSFKKINEISISKKEYDKWVEKFASTLKLSYKKAPEFSKHYDEIVQLFKGEFTNIGELAKASVKYVINKLGISSQIVHSSTVYKNQDLHSVSRVLDICTQEKASLYINPSGGKSLYSKENFLTHKLELGFIETREIYYNQGSKTFIANLSILDMLMYLDVQEINNSILPKYSIV